MLQARRGQFDPDKLSRVMREKAERMGAPLPVVGINLQGLLAEASFL